MDVITVIIALVSSIPDTVASLFAFFIMMLTGIGDLLTSDIFGRGITFILDLFTHVDALAGIVEIFILFRSLPYVGSPDVFFTVYVEEHVKLFRLIYNIIDHLTKFVLKLAEIVAQAIPL